MGVEYPVPSETIRKVDFVAFRPEKVSNLTSWEAIEIEARRKWIFRHKEFDTEQNRFFFEVYRPQTQIKDTAEMNRASFVIDNASATLSAPLTDVRDFLVGTVNPDTPQESQAIIFRSINKQFLEIHDNGYFRTNTIVTFDPHF